ncbi:MAG: HAD hydrolase-like protein [Clostridia bacterium]|nr:HAD hydrolase-like protein [Clostridia bacterium]MEE1025166.1 HAD hydrolase-like protein [Acutalibacteraceae bacterium]
MSKNYLFFDLDGTLTNSMSGIFAGLRYAFKKCGVEDRPDEELKKYIGPPLMFSFVNYTGMSEELACKALAAYREFYRETGVHMNTLYTGIADMIKALHKAGKKLYVASSKPEEQVRIIIEENGLSEYFEFIGGATLDKSRADKISVLRYVIENAGAPPVEECVMIGDRLYDAEGADYFGMDCIGVLWGFAEDGEFDRFANTKTVKTPDELLLIV